VPGTNGATLFAIATTGMFVIINNIAVTIATIFLFILFVNLHIQPRREPDTASAGWYHLLQT